MKFVAVVALLSWIALTDAAWSGATSAIDPGFRTRIARFFAPVIYQNTAHARLDFITRFDFDDWNPKNQHVNVLDTKYPLKAHVYHAVIAAKHHFFIGYAVYHPMDWKGGFGHESDFEGLLLVVERESDDRWGSILAAETLAHDQIYQYTNHIDVRNRGQDIDAGLSTRDNLDGRQGMHPEVIIEAKGHGIFGFGHRVQPAPTVVQYYPGDAAEGPSGQNDDNVAYLLVDLLTDRLWTDRRAALLYKEPFANWTGSAYEQANALRLLGKFQIDGTAAGGARPPWAWNDHNDGDSLRGDWLIAPAFTFAHHLRVPGLRDDDLDDRDYYRWNGFMNGESGTNPTFVSRVRSTTTPEPQEAGVGLSKNDKLYAFSSEQLKAWIPTGEKFKEGSAPGLQLLGSAEGRQSDVVAALISPTLTIPLGAENFLRLQYRNPDGVPAARVVFEYNREGVGGKPITEERTILLPSLTVRKPGVAQAEALDHINELILQSNEPFAVLRQVRVTFTGDLTGFNKAHPDLLPQRIRDQMRVFATSLRSERSIEIHSLAIVTRQPVS